jgi:phenylacetic acid degradation operon negative regulatory protein
LTSDPALPGAVVFEADQPFGDLPELARRHWPLDDVAAAYRVFLDRFSGLGTYTAQDALALRLRLVDDYRSAALADPRLPKGALPDDWPADEARRLFVRLYLAMSESASRQIPALCESQDGPLPPQAPASSQREACLITESHSL